MNKPHENAPTDLMDRRSVRLGLFVVIPLVVFVLVSAAIRVSQYGIDHTIIVLGQKELVAGWTSAMRVSLISDSGEFYRPTRIVGHIRQDGVRHLLFNGSGEGNGTAVAIHFTVPKLTHGPATLTFDIEFDERKRTVEAMVQIARQPGPDSAVVPMDIRDKPRPHALSKDGHVLEVFTEDRGAPTGLASVVFIRARDAASQPVSIPLEIAIPDEASTRQTIPRTQSIETDALGLFALPAKPRELGWPIRVKGSTKKKDGEQTAEPTEASQSTPGEHLHPDVIYAGLSAVLHNPIAHRGDRLRISARQLSSAGPLYVDLFKDGYWVQAASGQFRGGSATAEISPSFHGLGRMQVATSALAPGKNVLVRQFYILAEHEDLTDGLRVVLKELTSSSLDGDWAESVLALPLSSGAGFDRRLANAFSLSRLYRGHSPPNELIHSRRTDDKELAAYKGRFQRMVMLAILLIGFGVAALIVLMAMRAHQTQQRITLMIMADETDSDSESHDGMDPASARRRAVVQIVVLFLIIMGAFVSVAILVDTLTWQR